MSTELGRAAERVAAHFLQQRGFTIIEQNWRTRWCEIDLVAAKHGVAYLVEVKYRKSTAWGSGFDYITARKLQQMRLAARFWQASHRAVGCRLSAVELTGQPPAVTGWLESLD